jgi:hypothetical protein
VADAPVDFAAIGFKLRFTGATCPDAAAELRHLNASSGKARQHVFKLCQFNLQLAFSAAGMAGKNIKNELGAIDDPRIYFFFNIALLGRRKLMIDENQIGINGNHSTGDFLELTFADERGGIRTVTMLDKFSGDLRAGGKDQLAKLSQRFFHANARDTFRLRTVRRYIARKHGAGRNVQITVGTGAVTELQSYKKRTLRTITTSLDPGRRLKTAGTLPRNKLALRLAGTAFAFT